MTESLTTTEEQRLYELESQIESNVAMVGRALFEIRESRLYRITHATFEDYCRERFAMNRDYIDKQIKCAEVVNNLHTIGMDAPTNERQARPLAKLPAEQQPAAWEKAQDIAKEEGKPVAARHVEIAVAEIMPPKQKPAPAPPSAPEPDPVIADEVTPAMPKRLPKYIPNDAHDIWAVAQTHLNRILPNDISREEVLLEVIEYCQERISTNK